MNPTGPGSGVSRSTRGGSWYDGNPTRVRTSSRLGRQPTHRDGYLGFRCAQVPN
ncbi:MAG: SUMF1/EgtB/PvdO family nonheme iron enzyme [Deltaproteobacteria bacterium]|nr:SUMF1/EgtB/PvdO family nonheme iron enzyme [Deltaproteobacteria bacterium]